MMNKRRTARSLVLPALLLAAAIACSPENSGPAPEESQPNPEESETGGAPPELEPESKTSMGGAGEPITHPLLGAGNYTGADSSDPCDQAQLWELDVLLDLSTGATVLFEGSVYEVTGPGSDHGYTMASIAPPGDSEWVQEQYGYELVKSCAD